jgi:hypothetical protein
VRSLLQAPLECPRAPDAAEVVRLDHRLDPLGLEGEEVAATGDARVVDEEIDARVPLEDGGGGAVDVLTVGDVTELVLAAQLGRERLEPLPTPRHEHAVPPSARKLARCRLADPARGAGDHRHVHAGDATCRRARRAAPRPSGPWRR